MTRFWKAIGALLGATVGATVDTVSNMFGVDFPAEVDGAIAVLLAALGALVAPKNKEKVAKPEGDVVA